MTDTKTTPAPEFNMARLRLLIFAAVGALHIVLIFFVAFQMNVSEQVQPQQAAVMRLLDVSEVIPPPPPPEVMPEIIQTTTEAIAEHMIETDEVPQQIIVAQNYAPPAEVINYLPQSRINVLPVLPEDEIVARMVYPPIAQRSGIEGTVRLELFIDRYGIIRDVRVLREDPEGRGFGEAALAAFRGINATAPAQADGQAVAVRFWYNLRFTLR
jgi:protein TonB